jgi:hypothetical protein
LSCLFGGPGADPVHLNAFYGSVYPAICSFQLALRARGLGTTVTGYHLNGHEADVAALLSIPPNVTQIALLPIATSRHPVPPRRPPGGRGHHLLRALGADGLIERRRLSYLQRRIDRSG